MNQTDLKFAANASTHIVSGINPATPAPASLFAGPIRLIEEDDGKAHLVFMGFENRWPTYPNPRSTCPVYPVKIRLA